MATYASESVCGALGCTEVPAVVVEILRMGERTVCDDHARNAVDLCDPNFTPRDNY
ncbi:hypothetical protein [Halobaculum limi]|uniref:hypothetical protein n=1 Tax=Halobaculum limi TaxID=3031916 RepID=UPI002404CD2D|nr:hypothetical protein [Halobaculum sp. YSMS11]